MTDTALMTDVLLYGHWTCPFVNRVDFALAQRGIDHRLVDVPPSAVRPEGFVLPAEFVAHSPRLEVPMVCIETETGDREYLADSIPILEWLETRLPAPSLLGANPSLVMERVRRLDGTAMRAMGGVAYGTDPAGVERAALRLAAALAEMNEWLGASTWLAGAEPTLAEAIAVPIYLRLPGLEALGFDRGLPARVAEHRARTLALRGGRHVAWSDDQRAEYLGRHQAFKRRSA